MVDTQRDSALVMGTRSIRSGGREVLGVLIICAWCPLFGRPAAVLQDGDPHGDRGHGICQACAAAMLSAAENSKSRVRSPETKTSALGSLMERIAQWRRRLRSS